MKLLLMADGVVGGEIAHWLLEKYPDDLGAVITVTDNAVHRAALARSIPSYVQKKESQLLEVLASAGQFELGVLAWWPRIITSKLLSITKHGFINTHPSLLPHNRGKHYNFWALVEQAPFGVSLHFVDDGIDSGDIIAQSAIPYSWEDNGQSLYQKASQEMVRLFRRTYPDIRECLFQRVRQDPSQGSLHYARELEPASRIDLDQLYRARDLLNLIRARTFDGHPSCWFEDGGVSYEIRVQIARSKHDTV